MPGAAVSYVRKAVREVRTPVTETRWIIPTVEALHRVEEPKDDVKQQADEEDE